MNFFRTRLGIFPDSVLWYMYLKIFLFVSRTMAGTTAEQILIMNDETRTMTDLIPTPGDMTRTTDPLPLPILTTAALLHPQTPLTGGPTQSRTGYN